MESEPDNRGGAWERALPYVPRTLIDLVASRPADRDGWVTSLEGSFLVADISGFTPLSEQLARLGAEGAERLTTTINAYFELLLGVAAGAGGDNLKFGGDALLLAFRGDGHADRAVSAALRMQQATARFPSVRVGGRHQRLAMSIGVHTATLWFATAGSSQRHQHLLFGGEAARLAATEGAAQRGEVVITEETAAALTGAHVERVDDRLVARAIATPPHEPSRPARLDAAVADALLPFLPPAIADDVRSGSSTVPLAGDHRRVAVIFIGLRGINELADQAGPEVAFDELRSYLRTVLGLLDRHHGYLAGNDIDPHGTKLICLFGAPVAAEDDAAAALRFTIDLLDTWNGRDTALQHQIGVNLGPVFAGDAGTTRRRDYTILGDHVNLAARLMGAAEPGTAVVASWLDETDAGPRGVLEPAEPVRLKGKSEPVPVGVLRAGTRWRDVAVASRATALVGRDAELRRLSVTFDAVAAGAGTALRVVGDAGTGKSVLVDVALRDRADWRVLQGRCHAYTTAQPFSCWMPVLRGLFGIEETHGPAERLDRARRTLAELLPERVHDLGLLVDLLGLDEREGVRWAGLDGEARRELTFAFIVDLVVASASPALAIVLEDLQWADTSSVALLTHLATALDGTPVALVATSRPSSREFLADTPTIVLGPLDRDAITTLLDQLLGLRGATLVDTVWAKTAGNPLFATELAGLLAGRVSGDGGAVDVDDLPDRIQGLLMSRIDLLAPDARQVLTSAAVLGAEFERTTLEELVDVADTAAALESLRHERLIQPSSTDRFVFTQNLLQDVAYNSLRFSHRRELHRRAASSIERRFADHLDPHLSDLARHHRHGGDPRRTIRYAVAAGDRARRVHAYHEALTSYQHALVAVDAIRRDNVGGLRSIIRERIADSLDLLGNHREAGTLYRSALRGWRASTAVPADLIDLTAGLDLSARATSLCCKIAWAAEHTQAEFDEAARWLDAADRALPGAGHEALRGAIEIARATILFRTGRYDAAIDRAHLALALSEDADPDQRAQANEALARPLLEVGRLEEAVHHRRAALSVHEEVGDLLGLMIAHNNIGTAEQLLGHLDAALDHYGESRRAASRLRRGPSVAIVENNIGEVLLLQDRPADAVAHLQACVDAFDGSGAVAGLALVNLARAYGQLGRIADARDAVETGILRLEEVGADGLLVEALLERAEVTRAAGDEGAALAQAEQARSEAEAHGMQLVASRAHLLLGRLAVARHDPDTARRHLTTSRDLAVAAGADGQVHDAEAALAGVSRSVPAR